MNPLHDSTWVRLRTDEVTKLRSAAVIRSAFRVPRLAMRSWHTWPIVAAAVLLGGPAGWAEGQTCDIEVGWGSTVTLNGNFTADCLDVAGTLNVGGTLTITGPVSTVDGTVNLTGSSSKLKFTNTGSTSIEGNGKLAGQNDSAQVSIASGTCLTSYITICGALAITGAGRFTNQGTVDANASGTLLVAANTVADSAGENRWKSTHAGAVLKFSDPASACIGQFGIMAGEFVLSAGVIEFNTALIGASSRHLTMSGGALHVNEDLTMGNNSTDFAEITGGTIDVAAGATFVHH